MTPLIKILALLGTSHAHRIMNTPTPFNYNTKSLVQANPLYDKEHNLPFAYQVLSHLDAVTLLAAVQSQLANFSGGGQHGGGSSQFSLTYEYPPPADKYKWKTICTLIGGCPVEAEGNLPAVDKDPRFDSKQCGNEDGVEYIRKFNVPIPKNIPNGNTIFA